MATARPLPAPLPDRRTLGLTAAGLAARVALGGLAAGAAWAPVTAWAQSGDAAQRVEISAQPANSDTEQRRRDPVAKSVYGRDELDKHGDSNVTDVLKRLPGVSLSGGNPRLRGLGAGYTLILVNGEPAPPGFSLDNLPPSQVERIEVIKGPTAEYPAVAGTINVVLREVPRQRQGDWRLATGYQALGPTLASNGSWGDRTGALNYVLPYALYQWRGQTSNQNSRLAPREAGADEVQVAGLDRWWGHGFNLGPRLGWKLGEQDTLNLQLFAQRNDFNNDGVFDTTVLQGTPPTSLQDRYWSGGYWQMLRGNGQWLRRSADGARLELKLAAQASSSRSRNHTLGTDGAEVLTITRDSRQHNVEHSQTQGVRWSQPLGEAHTLALGWETEQRSRREQRSVVENGAEQLAGVEGQPFDAAVWRSAAFVQDEWEIAPRWSSQLGLRAEQVRTSSAGLDGRRDSSALVWSPVAHLNHKLNDKGRDLLRMSLSRSARAPELGQLMGRYNLNTLYDRHTPNTPIAPDRSGNPALQPERATGLDIALESYLPAGGVASVGLFHRRISGLIRQTLRQEAVAQADVPRWVQRPVNLASARSTGLELELKGQAAELLPAGWGGGVGGLGLRASLSVYRSSVQGLPGPDDRLEGQQPWSGTLGADWLLGPVLAAWPLTVGASLALTPAYTTQVTESQRNWQSGSRALDAYALLTVDRRVQLRLSVANLVPRHSSGQTEVQADAEAGTARSSFWRGSLRNLNLSLTFKL